MIFCTGSFDKKAIRTLNKNLEKGDVIIDIGANIGSMAIHCAKSVGDHGKVYAIEPSDFAYSRMCRNISLNTELQSRITVGQHFITQKNSKPSEVFASWNMQKGMKRHPNHMGTLTATAGASPISLDQFVRQNQIQKLDWLKIDVDGFECEVLKGAYGTLKNFRPKIFLELSEYTLIEQGENLESMLQFLFDQNYSLVQLNGRILGKNIEHIRKRIPYMGAINVFAFADENI